MKKLVLVLVACLGIATLAACGNNDVVVQTKSGNITKDEFYTALKSTSSGSSVLQQLVYEKLLEQKYNVSSKSVDAKYNQVRKTFASEAQFEQALSSNNLTKSSFRRQLKDSLMMEKAQQSGIKVTDKALEAYYDKNKTALTELKASDIVVSSQDTANTVEAALKSGQDFATLAKKYSTDSTTKSKGGELGWFKQSAMDSDFSAAAMKLSVGQISDPVYSTSEKAYHVIKLEGKKDDFKSLKSSVKEAYLASKEKSQDAVLQSLVKQGGIKVNDSQFKDLFSSTSQQ
ncbi:MAG: peptidylprolyl isomerase [Sporolactobacillus sp.]